MHMYICLAMAITGIAVSTSPPPKPIGVGKPDITKINKDLHMREGDIMEARGRSSLLGEEYRWELPVPYVLHDGLDINAKGIIFRAFEQFRLKSCIDFKLRECETSYISIEKENGCWSYVGRQFGLQQLSIGQYCDELSTVEHELLHALGFWHEQSRYDRDNHVRILVENIESGKKHNFDKKSSNTSSTQGTPYDYWSVMHYGQYAFSKGREPTIITNDPKFQDVIGQRQDMSSLDILELNMLYGCNDSISFLDHCSFDEGMCEMSSVGWQRVRQADGGPLSDHTHLDMDSQNETDSMGFFMHVNMTLGQEEFSTLQTRRLTPRRTSNVQCLEFFYYHSGNKNDSLNIWMIEFDSENDTVGIRTPVGQIKGSPADYWQLHYVSLNATKTFQVEFEAHKGTGESSSGFSVDDINLSETECPHQIWQIRNLEQVLNSTAPGTFIYSPKYYTSDGYRYQGMLRIQAGPYISVFIRLVSGNFDDQLQWPLNWRQMTFHALDQNPDIRYRMSKEFSFTTDPTDEYAILWHNPRENGTYENGTDEYRNAGYGVNYWMSVESLRRRSFLKGGDLFLLFDTEDITHLLQSNSFPCGVNSSTTTPVFTTMITESTTTPVFTTMITESTTEDGRCEDIFCSACSMMSLSPMLLLVTLILFLSV